MHSGPRESKGTVAQNTNDPFTALTLKQVHELSNPLFNLSSIVLKLTLTRSNVARGNNELICYLKTNQFGPLHCRMNRWSEKRIPTMGNPRKHGYLLGEHGFRRRQVDGSDSR